MTKRFDLHNQRFAGERMTQAWSDLCLWEAFFNERRLGTLIELGTGAGGMALFLGLQCHQRGIQFYTFDHQQHFDFSRGLAQLINLHASFRHVDIFSEAGIEYISGVMEDCPRPLAGFFDNGNKRREWSLFAARLRAGDFCIVHDWGKEFTEEDIGGEPVERVLDARRWKSPRQPTGMTVWFERRQG